MTPPDVLISNQSPVLNPALRLTFGGTMRFPFVFLTVMVMGSDYQTKFIIFGLKSGREISNIPMKNPHYSGRVVRQDCLEPLRLSVTGGDKVLGVTRQALNNLVNGKSGISPEMALRLSRAFGSTPEMWLRLQMNYDLAQLRRRESEITVTRYQLDRVSG